VTGRNDPCPCGSGKKYKRCHGAHEGEAEQIQALYDFDANLLREIGDWSVGRFGQRWRELAAEYLTEETLQFDVPLFMYVVPIDGKTSAEWFSEEQGAKLDPRKRAFLNANTRAWLSVWAVTQVEPGRGVELADLLTKETRKVREIAASRTLSPRDMLLARIIDIEGTSIFAGVHRQPLLPRGAMDVVDELRKVKLVGEVTVDQLRELKTSRLMVAIWEREAADLAERARRGPTPHNTDGDDLMYTADSYTFAPDDRDAVDRALGQFPIVERERPGDAIRYTFLRADNPVDTDGTVIGSAFISSNRLRLESNSVRRADELRERVEAAVGKLLEGHERELLDPLHPPPGALESEEPAASGPLSGESVREQKERFYQNWADSPIPALGERTPRQAMKSEKYKQRLQLMLREVEGIEARQPEADRFDVSALYDALGLER
jgi:hypothetical protein